MEGKSDTAIDTFIKCSNTFPTNKKYKYCMYKVALCYAEKSIESHNNNINEMEKGMYNTKYCYYDECDKKWIIKPLDYVPVSESNEVGRWLNKAFDEGYDDWCSIIYDSNLKQFINEKEIIEVIKKMKKKNPSQNMWSNEIASYISVHNI